MILKKKILVITNYFYPEEFKINDLVFELRNRGYKLTVITAVPNYPFGSFFDGYGLLKKNKEILSGVEIYRLPIIPRKNGKPLWLILNYFSYFFSLTIFSIIFSLFNRFDIIFVHHCSPPFLGLSAILANKIQNSKLYFWDLDLWPESVTSASKIKNYKIIEILHKMMKFIYSRCDRILIGSYGFKNKIMKYGVPETKITYFPNWAEDFYLKVCNEFVDDKYSSHLPNESFKIMFAGNIGEAQDIESILKAIISTKKLNEKIIWLFVGVGRKLDWLKNMVSVNQLESNVFFFGRHPVTTMPSFYLLADAMLITLKKSPIFELTVPSKLQPYLACQKPILGMLDGDGYEIIKNARCGLVTAAGDWEGLSDNAFAMSKLSSTELSLMGINGFERYNSDFSKNVIIERLIDCIDIDINN